MYKAIVVGCAVVCLTAATTIAASPASAVPACGGLRATIVGTAGDDFVFGTKARDVVYLGAGADYFEDHFESPGGGNDVVCGGSGADILLGHDGNDLLLGGTGDDSLEGGGGKDQLRGEDGRDHVTGGPGDDRMHAGPAGDGDSVSFAGSGSGWGAVRVDLAAGTAHGQGHDRLTGFISVHGSGRADVIRGTDGNNYIESMGGRDKVYSLAGADYIGLDVGGVVHAGPGNDAVSMGGSGDVRSGPGNDLIQITRGRPRVDGGTDSDTFRVFGYAKPWILGGGGVDTVDLGRRLQGVIIDLVDHSSGMGVWSVESIFGTSRSDVIRGADADESFHGRGGHDRLFGRGGEDSLHGDGGTDRADGGAGQDQCHAEVMISC